MLLALQANTRFLPETMLAPIVIRMAVLARLSVLRVLAKPASLLLIMECHAHLAEKIHTKLVLATKPVPLVMEMGALLLLLFLQVHAKPVTHHLTVA